MKRFAVTSILGLWAAVFALGQQKYRVDYSKGDSAQVVFLLQTAQKGRAPEGWVLHYARKFLGIPYVGQTLERNDTEKLVVNLREMDCTTMVEQVLALALCARRKQTRFSDYCEALRHIRYIGGEVSYVKRQHYFTTWINANEKAGLIRNIKSPNPPFLALQKVNVNYMTTHVGLYRMLYLHREWLPEIRQMEREITGQTHRYIPKSQIKNTKLLRKTIKNGDILTIITSKKGLDTSHIGFAVWKKDGLHLLNASSIHKKVVEESMTLRRYMYKHPTHLGIRVSRMQ